MYKLDLEKAEEEKIKLLKKKKKEEAIVRIRHGTKTGSYWEKSIVTLLT